MTRPAPRTGQDLLREPDNLALLAPHLNDLDVVIFLGDCSVGTCALTSLRPASESV